MTAACVGAEVCRFNRFTAGQTDNGGLTELRLRLQTPSPPSSDAPSTFWQVLLPVSDRADARRSDSSSTAVEAPAWGFGGGVRDGPGYLVCSPARRQRRTVRRYADTGVATQIRASLCYVSVRSSPVSKPV